MLQLRIDHRQEEGLRLRELVLELLFTEGHPGLGATSCLPSTAEPSLIILEPPSPKYLKGKAATQHVSREPIAQPQMGAGGVSIGEVRVRVTEDKDIERSWRFQSHWANIDLGSTRMLNGFGKL